MGSIAHSDLSADASNIVTFFENRSILITGATGFLGKALLEKIIRVCPGIAAIFILIRQPTGHSINQKLFNLLNDPLFENVRRQSQKNISKIIPILGDISLPGLGISEEDRKTLCQEVSVVIHSAATINFNGRLQESFNINVKGTQRLVELSKAMEKLVAFIHISTAYSNCDRYDIDECVYTMPTSLVDLEIQLKETTDVKAQTQLIIGAKPNTYVYTKAIAESFLKEESKIIPVSIIRPSIIWSVWKDPLPGWIDSGNNLALIFTSWAKGVLYSLLVRSEKVVDIIPVDIVVNLILAAAWELGSSDNKKLRVFNCCNGDQNPITWEKLRQLLNKEVVVNPISEASWYPHMTFCSSVLWSALLDKAQRYIPALVLDVSLLITTGKQKYLKLYHGFQKLSLSCQFFRTNDWNFTTSNMTKLYSNMSCIDQKLFNVQFKDFNWNKYVEGSVAGLGKYVLKEDDTKRPIFRQRIRTLLCTKYISQALIVVALISLIRLVCSKLMT